GTHARPPGQQVFGEGSITIFSFTFSVVRMGLVKWSARCRHRVTTGVMPGWPASTVHGPFTRSSPHGGRLVHLSGDRRYAVLSPRFRGPPRPLPKVVVGPRQTRAHGRAVAA